MDFLFAAVAAKIETTSNVSRRERLSIRALSVHEMFKRAGFNIQTADDLSLSLSREARGELSEKLIRRTRACYFRHLVARHREVLCET